MDTKIFSQRLKELRLKKGVRQEDVAHLLGVTTNHYQKIEYGQIMIAIDTLDLLADYYQVSADYLLGREEAELP